ncbi:hypothetical protein I0C86_21655 [Plantactinospora sp. S1510]|uniref:Lipoprotein LpqB beta-propeller domain-containing protein n=1 Tax=Plantactinospora alkalitolerans TaxID=2789879 RepID=A0ABS0GZA9_9ACTN|nr:hypothetical protein [Plantactinospora alkalitolerans]MBF9131548.1 hypothetical protein [Plantactinospora alkalitolerans]
MARGNRTLLAGLALLVVAATGGCDLLPFGGGSKGAAAPWTVPADYAEVGGLADRLDELGVTGTRQYPEKSAVLRGPHFELHLLEVGATPALSAAAVDDAYLFEAEGSHPEYPAGAGRELLVARLEEKLQSIGSRPEELLLGVRVDGVDRLVRMKDWPSTSLIVVSVPAGTDAALLVTDMGRTQSISLRSGRVLERIEGYYPPLAGGADAKAKVQVTAPGVRLVWGNPVEARALVSVKLEPYVNEGGWAPTGRIWLTGKVWVSLGEPELTATIDVARSVRVTGPGGLAIRVPNGQLAIKPNRTLPNLGGSSDEVTIFAEVPADLKQLTVTFMPKGSFAVADNNAPVRWRAPARAATDTLILSVR